MIQQINTRYVYPESKDRQRAREITTPGDASKMAKLITDPYKLIRRTKAVMQSNPNFRQPFITKMKAMGFSAQQILNLMELKTTTVLMPKAA